MDDPDARAKQALHSFMALADFVNEPLMLLNADGQLLATNRAAIRLLSSTVCRPDGSLLSSAENREGFARYLALAARSTGPLPGVLQLRAQDGSVRSLRCGCGRVMLTHPDERKGPDKLLLLRCADKLGADQQFIALNKQIANLRREVEARRHAEQALRKSERRFQDLFASAPDATLIFDREGTIVLANASLHRELGYPAGVLSGKPVSTLLNVEPKSTRSVMSLLSAPFDDASASSPGRMRARRYDGTEVVVDVRLRCLETDEGPVVVAALRNLTEQLEAERERRGLERKMQQAQKLESLGVLAGGIAHDFNNLLLSVMGNADLILLEPVSAAVREYVQDLVTSAERAADLCKQLLAYSGRGRFVIRPASLSEMVREMTKLLEVSISKKSVIHYDVANDLPLVDVDQTQIRQVIMNLIINASDALGEAGGQISIRTGCRECDEAYLYQAHVHGSLQPGSYVFLEVSDNGSGIAPGDIARIFDPFFTTKSTGRGLGLAAVIGIVRAHRGALKVVSEVGRGTTFKVLLPVGSGAAQPSEPNLRSILPWQGCGTVLLVEDEAAVRTVARKILERYGFQVLEAQDGRAALALLEAHRSSIVAMVLDLTMPVLDGEETLTAVRHTDRSLPIVLASGYSDRNAPMHASQDRALHFVQKPFRAHELMEAIRKLLEAP